MIAVLVVRGIDKQKHFTEHTFPVYSRPGGHLVRIYLYFYQVFETEWIWLNDKEKRN